MSKKKKVVNARIQNKYAVPSDWDIASKNEFKPLYGEIIMHENNEEDNLGNIIPKEPTIYVGDGETLVSELVPVGYEASCKIDKIEKNLTTESTERKSADTDINEKTTQLRTDLDNIELIASAVKFNKNLIFTKDFGYYTITNGKVTIPTKDNDMSLQQLLETAFAQDQNPTITKPSATIKFSTVGNFEVGTTITPSVKFTANHLGSYSFGPNSTGASWTKLNYGDTEVTVSNNNVPTNSYKFPSITVKDNTNAKLTASISYSGATISPLTALGNEYADGKFSADVISSNATVKGFRRMFFRTFTDMVDVTDGSNIRPSQITDENAPKASSGFFKLTIPAGTKQVCVALPYGWQLGTVVPTQGLQVDIASSFIPAADVLIKGAALGTETDYTTYTLTAPDGLGSNTYTIEIVDL